MDAKKERAIAIEILDIRVLALIYQIHHDMGEPQTVEFYEFMRRVEVVAAQLASP